MVSSFNLSGMWEIGRLSTKAAQHLEMVTTNVHTTRQLMTKMAVKLDL